MKNGGVYNSISVDIYLYIDLSVGIIVLFDPAKNDKRTRYHASANCVIDGHQSATVSSAPVCSAVRVGVLHFPRERSGNLLARCSWSIDLYDLRCQILDESTFSRCAIKWKPQNVLSDLEGLYFVYLLAGLF